MIQKLRNKFILINMVFVTTILLAVVGTLIYSNSKKYRQESRDLLARAIDIRQEREDSFRKPIRPAHGPEPKWNPAMHVIPFFTVSLKADGSFETIIKREVTIEDSVAEDLAAQAMASDAPEGYLRDYSLRYMKRPEEDGAWFIAFVDYSYEQTAMKVLLINCFLLFSAAEVAFLGLSVYLSRWALNPVERAWEQQNQFIADASHELKTPITVILANLGILSAHPDASIGSQGKWLENTRYEAERMRALIEDLLFLAKNGANASPQTFSEVDLSDTLWSCLLPFESVAFENGVELESDITPGLHLQGNEGQIKQLIAILLDNACKYAGVKGRVRVSAGVDGQKRPFLRVANTGDPIQKEDLDHIFERFYRADKSRVRKAGGYGLGLSIAKAIANRHHGQILAKSEAGEGTVFTVTFPARPEYTDMEGHGKSS